MKSKKMDFFEKKPLTALVILLGILGIIALIADSFAGTTIAGISINAANLPLWVFAYVITLGVTFNLENNSK